MSILFIGSNVTLLLCALLLAGRSYQLFEQHAHKACMVISLSATFIACSAASTLFIQQPGQDLLTLKLMLNNLAFYASIPLLASAFIDIAWKHDWSKPAWGRWLLALFALFELARRAEIGAQYSQIMATISIAALLISFIKKANSTALLLGILASTLMAASLLIFSPTSIMPGLENSHYAAFSLAAALITLTKALPSRS